MFAYIDPGTGLLIWQGILAAFVGFLFYIKRTRHWIVAHFKKIFRRGQKSPTTATTVTAELPGDKVETKTEAP